MKMMERSAQDEHEEIAGTVKLGSSVKHHSVYEPPLQPDQEWANALTHGIAAIGAVILGVHLVIAALPKEPGLAIACAIYSASVFGTFFFSTMSHMVRSVTAAQYHASV